MFTVFMLAGRLPVPKKRPRKRKSFDDLTVNGRRRGLRDLGLDEGEGQGLQCSCFQDSWVYHPTGSYWDW